MDVRGNQTEMPRLGLPRSPERPELVVWGVAAVLALLFAAGQILSVLTAAPAAIAFHRQAGDTPWFVAFTAAIGWPGLLAMLGILDAAIFAGFLWLAKRYWTGFAFLPPLLYLGLGSVVLWLLIAEAVSWVLLSA